jgi:hypothetical protein
MFTAKQVIEAIRGRPGVTVRTNDGPRPEPSSMGVKTVVARRLGCSWDTVDRYAKRYTTVQQALDTERELLIDMAEVKLGERVMMGEWPAIQFVLKTLGKERGYTERQEITGAEGGAMIINYTGNVNPEDV